ncbi:MAG: protein kinase [Planctomycetes bacterium]|nr:protein kinase [Planctomycetota bacterium]
MAAPSQSDSDAPPAVDAGVSPAAPMQSMGPYRINGELGRGGMGVVYKAVHDTLERPAALKLLPTEFASNPEYVSRFLREARVAATLRHDHIVQVYDAGMVQGRYYMAMELVDGTSLGKYIDKSGPVAEAEGLRLMLQAAEGLAAAHEKDLVHRDIKPDNLLLDEKMNVRIVDFGLVMESASTTHLTVTGATMGTPLYMSPEQVDGEKADGRSDIYSLGVTFYRAFTGHLPFEGGSMMNLLYKHKFEAPEDPKKYKPELSKNLCNLLLTMMAKRREDRPQSAKDLADLVRKVQQGKKIPPPPAVPLPQESMNSSGVAKGSITITVPSALAGKGKWLALGGLAAVLALSVLSWLIWGRKGGDPSTASANAPDANGTKAQPAPPNPEGHPSGTSGALPPPPVDPVPADPQPAPNPYATALADAERFQGQGDLLGAAQSYRLAAARAPLPAEREPLYAKAADLEYRHWSAKGKSAEAQGKLLEAVSYYDQALTAKPDSDLRKHRDALAKQAVKPDPIASYLVAGQKALREKDYVAAKANFEQVVGQQPGNAEAKKGLQIADAWLALESGDRALRENHLEQAHRLYQKAQLVEEVRPAATERMAEVTRRLQGQTTAPADPVGLPAPPPPVAPPVTPVASATAQTIANVEALLRAGRSRDAQITAANALQKSPRDISLQRLKAAVDATLGMESVYAGLGDLATKALAAVGTVLEKERNYPDAEELKRDLRRWNQTCASAPAEFRQRFSGADDEPARRALADARKLAQDMAASLIDARARFEKKADQEEKGLSGLLGFGKRGNKENATLIRNAGNKLFEYGRQAEVYGK